MEDEAAERLNMYWLFVEGTNHFQINTYLKSKYTILRYATKNDLDKLLSLPKDSKVTLRKFPDFGERSEKEMTLEEACKEFGSKIMSQPRNAAENISPQVIRLLKSN